MGRSTREWFIILDDKLRVIGPRGYPDVTSAILAADHLASWPKVKARIVVRSDHADDGIKVGSGTGRDAAVREGGRWSGSDVTAGSGYLVDSELDAEHARRHNLPPSKKTPVEIRAEVDQLLRETKQTGSGRPRSRR